MYDSMGLLATLCRWVLLGESLKNRCLKMHNRKPTPMRVSIESKTNRAYSAEPIKQNIEIHRYDNVYDAKNKANKCQKKPKYVCAQPTLNAAIIIAGTGGVHCMPFLPERAPNPRTVASQDA